MIIARFSRWCAFLALMFFPLLTQAFDYAAHWKQVEKAQNEGLPKTALEALEPILAAALEEKNHNEAAKAVAAQLGMSDVDSAGRIRLLQEQLKTLPEEMRPLFTVYQAQLWQNYYNENRWRLLQRSRTSGVDEADFLTWDATRVLAEIDRLIAEAMQHREKLQTTPVTVFDKMLKWREGMLPDVYRPTLYDFLVFQAIDLYSLGEREVAAPENAFVPQANSPLLGTLEEFLAWQPETTDTASGRVKAIRLFQDLLRFHQKDGNQVALSDADRQRILWAQNVLGETAETRTRTEAALRAFIERWKGVETASYASADLAVMLLGQSERENETRSLAMQNPWLRGIGSKEIALAAYQVAMQGIALHPNSPGAARCRGVVKQLEAKEFSQMQTEFVWNAPWPNVTVRYKNLEKIHLRAVQVNWREFLQRDRNRPESLNKAEIKALLQQAPAKAWTVDLPKVNYATMEFSFAAPADLPKGFYIVLASATETFSEENNALVCTPVWVSDLALVCGRAAQQAGGGNAAGEVTGFVLQAESGEPIAGAKVSGWYLDNARERVALEPVVTDANGAFALSSPKLGSTLLLAEADGATVSSGQSGYMPFQVKGVPERTRQYVHFLSDRGIYRPGQAIQFKGIFYAANGDTNHYALLAGKKVVVAIDDPNGKEVERLELFTDGFGAASGSFTIPAGRLNGVYAIHTVGPENGRGYVRVEEYKRPKFEVKLEKPEIAAKLNEAVALSGSATAYTGAALDGATVKWSVRREVRWPRWCWWGPQEGAQAIAHGEGKTDAQGKFSVRFTALPDATVDPKNEPQFVYQVSAEVTDTTGETRDATQTVVAGYTALQATVSAEEWAVAAQPTKLKLHTASLDNVPQAASGMVMVYALQQPAQVQRPELRQYHYYRGTNENDPADPRTWKEGEGVAAERFASNAQGEGELSLRLPAGIYRAVLTTQDRFGKPVSARTEIRVYDPAAAKYPVKEAFAVTAEKWSLQPGETFTGLWGTGYDSGRAFVRIVHRDKELQSFWTKKGKTQQTITLPIAEEMRGGVALEIFQVRENRLHRESRNIDVPWKNKELQIGWERFNSKLVPGGRETWSLKVLQPDGAAAEAQLVAVLYDVSLDQFAGNFGWAGLQGAFYQQGYAARLMNFDFSNTPQSAWPRWNRLTDRTGWPSAGERGYREWEIFSGRNYVMRAAFGSSRGFGGGSGGMAMKAAAAPAMDMVSESSVMVRGRMEASAGAGSLSEENATSGQEASAQNLDVVTARKNLQETAFFFPSLIADKDGSVRIEFGVPEALTRWKFLAFAHDKEMRSGVFTDATAVTAKDLMVQPNPPRFLREGDVVEFTVKVTNQSEQTQRGKVRLNFADALTLNPVDVALGNGTPERDFLLAARSSTSLSWRVEIPDGQGYLIYKAVGAAGMASDGEEGFLPVLSRRQLVTESLPLPIRGAVTKKFSFAELLASGADSSLRHESLTVQMVSNPAWYAVMALPYLMEYQHECNEQIFSKIYANALARHIATSDPKIERMMNVWKNTTTLDSPLLKNEDLKSVLIAETPWVREAEGESARRRNVGILFDQNRVNAELDALLAKLAQRQLPDGSWSWFPEGPSSDYITRVIVAGFGRLQHLGVQVNQDVAKRAVPKLDAWLTAHLQKIKERAEEKKADYRKENNLDELIAFHLYARAFFLRDLPVPQEHQEAYDYFREQGRQHWLDLGRQGQGHLALALHRFGDKDAPAAIVRSLKEHAKYDGELGMFWAEESRGWFWWQAPVETQALMIELFDEVAQDAASVDDMQTWLLKQKQTQAWPSTRATADAVYALLLRGANKLASDALVKVSLAGELVEPKNVEPGTGFYSERWDGRSVRPKMGEITVSKEDEGVAWGNVTWQYFQDVDKIKAYTGTPLTLKKTLWKKVQTVRGEELVLVPQNKIAVGDTLIVRVELRVDRTMEFVHLKDQRGSGTEPVNVLSGYRWKDGLGYYETTGDTATHFFFDRVNPGTYVFEYPVRVQLRGSYQSGIAEVQCMYAPEFNSHSGSVRLVVE